MNKNQEMNENQVIEQEIWQEVHFDLKSFVNKLGTISYTTLLYAPKHIFSKESTIPSISFTQIDAYSFIFLSYVSQ